MSAPEEEEAHEVQETRRNMVKELREVREGLRRMRGGLEQTILELQAARLAARESVR